MSTSVLSAGEVDPLALINCPECGTSVSDHAEACTNCGYPIDPQPAAPTGPIPDDRLGQPRLPGATRVKGLSSGLTRSTAGFLWGTSGLYVIAAGAFVWYLFVWNDWAGQRSPSAAVVQTTTEAEATAFGFLSIAVIGYLITAVIFITWFFQAYRAAASRGATGRTWAAGWTIGGWALPFANFVIPKLVMNEVDRMSNPEAGDPPIDDRWKPLPRLEASDTWWGLFLLGAITTAIGSNWLPYADVKGSSYATAVIILACGMAATAGGGFAAGKMVRTIGDRLLVAVPETHLSGARLPGQAPDAPRTTTGREWIRGYEWSGYAEETVRCLSCRKDVSFPDGLKRHGTHKIAVPTESGNPGPSSPGSLTSGE